MRPSAMLFFLAACAGCAGTTVAPGHRGLYFDPAHGGVQHEILQPGWYRTPCGVFTAADRCPYVVDYAVTYTTSTEELHAVSDDGAQLDVTAAVIHRPIVTELRLLDAEMGPRYFEHVVRPELESAAYDVLSHTTGRDLERKTEMVENELARQLRERLQGKHVEISSVLVRNVRVARPEPAPCVAPPPPKESASVE